MQFKKNTDSKKGKSMVDKNFFETMQVARDQYDKYIELTSYKIDGKIDNSSNIKLHDINYPLNIVIKN